MARNRRRALLLATAALLFASPASAQQGKVWRIGLLETTSRTMNATNFDALRKGLQDLGSVEGKNQLIHYRSADGQAERFKELANDLILEKVDLIVGRGVPATRAAMLATSTIPIVVTTAGSPVRSGLVKSLARPGGNVTGLSSITADLSGKRVQLLKEIFPRIAAIGVLANMSNPNNQNVWQETEKAARSIGIRAQILDMRKAEDLGSAFEVARKERLGALIVVSDTVTQANRKAIVELALSNRLPTIGTAEFAAAGMLLSYAADVPNLYFRAASYIDRIFKGAKPGDLPMEEPTTLELIINVKTARALGVTIPPAVQLRADKLIE